MIRPKPKTLVLTSLCLLVAACLLGPLYLYFSRDVHLLKDHYPQMVTPLKNLTLIDPDYELKSTPPKSWVNLKDISKYAKWSIVLSEDWDFYNHSGVDPVQMKVAFNEMLEGSRFRGASTISQQM